MIEITLLVGYNSGGKTTAARKLMTPSSELFRVNRDLVGGTLDGLCNHVRKAINEGNYKFLMDNTYATIESRKSIIALAKELKAKIECIWLTTSFEDAQFNACTRMVRKHGRALTPEEMKKTKDPNDFPPVALFAYKKNFEKPTTEEGFDKVTKLPFERVKDPLYCNKALILDYDDTLRKTSDGAKYPTTPEQVVILPGRKEKLVEYSKKGYLLLGVSNQSGVAKGVFTEQAARDCFERTNELLDIEIDYLFCPHNVPPVNCYCRKPGPMNGVLHIERYKLDASQCIFVGDATTDATFATRCGFKYFHPDEFFDTK